MPGPDKRPDDNLVLMGRIGAAHGISGEVRIQSFAEDPESLPDFSPFSTQKPGQSLSIASARPSKNMLIARIEGIKTRTDAEKLNGTELYVPRDILPEADGEDDFYITDLIGLEVRNAEDRKIGEVIAMPNFGAGDLIEIRFLAGKSELFPFTKANVPDINIAHGWLRFIAPVEVNIRDIDGDDDAV